MPGLFVSRGQNEVVLKECLTKRVLAAAIVTVAVFSLFCLPVLSTPIKATECYMLVYDASIGPAEQPFQKFYDTLYKQAGLCAHSVGMSTKRAEQQLRSGLVDGDWSRVAGYVERVGGALVAVPQPVFNMAAYFIWLDTSGFDGSVQDVKGRLVGHHSGFRWLEWNLPVLEARPWALPSEHSVFELLERHRMEVYATGAVNAFALSKSTEGRKVPHRLGLWQEVPFYHVIHQHNADIVPRLDKALAAMIRSGEAAKILRLPGIKIAEVH